MSGIQLFNVQYKPSVSRPPVALLCQSVSIDQETFLWADGLTTSSPVLVPISAVRKIEPQGSFRDFMANRLDKTRAVLASSSGEHSPTILARAVQYMERDSKLHAEEALDMAIEQGLDILDQEGSDQSAMAAILAA